MDTRKREDLNLLSARTFKEGENATIDIYIEKLKELERNKDAKNVAISGSYGSGKSSIIKSYYERKDANEKNSYIIISIGSFLKLYESINQNNKINSNYKTDNNEATSDNELNDENSQIITDKKKSESNDDNGIITKSEERLAEKIEESIIKQLIHRNSLNDMTDSRLKRMSLHKGFIPILSFIFFLFPLIILFYETMLHLFNINLYDILSNNLLFNSISIFNHSFLLYELLFYIFNILYIVIMMILLYKIIITISNRKVGRLKVNNYEVELVNNDNSLFSKYLYEIVLFFYKNKTKVVCFEDIDRFPADVTIKIIEELKELNDIINNSFFMKDGKKIMFVYSFKDSIFKEYTQRTKFYDYILSIMPISSSYSSVINFKTELDGCNKVSDKLIEDVSKYIYDMRTIKSIVNDYKLFCNVLGINNDDMNDKIFGMAVFKNYYNKEYDKLLNFKEENNIEEKFNTINKKRNELKKNYEEEEAKLELKKNNIEQYKNTSIVVLKEALWKENEININGKGHYILSSERQITFDEYKNDDFNLSLIKNSSFYNTDGNHSEFIFGSFNSFEDFIDIINNNDTLKNIVDEIDSIDDKINEIDQLSINDLFKQYLYSNNNDRNVELLEYLIADNAISDDYIDYVTSPPIKEGLSQIDCRFIFNVLHNKSDIDIKLTHPDSVIKMLSGQFENDVILNMSLVDFILYNEDYKSSLDELTKNYKKLTELRCDFLKRLYASDIELFKKFINSINNNCKDFWEIVDRSLIVDDKLKNQIVYGLLFAPNLNIVNKESFSKHFNNIINDRYYLIMNNEICKNNIVILKLKINNIRVNNIGYRDFIIDNNCYVFNKNNLQNLFGINNLSNLYDDFYNNKNKASLFYKVEEESSDFYMNFYGIEKDALFNNQTYIKSLIDNKKIDVKFKEELLKREKVKLSYDIIKDFPDDIILGYNVMYPSWKSIQAIYSDENDFKIYNYIKNNEDVLFNKKNKGVINNLDELIIAKMIEYAVYDDEPGIIYNITDNYQGNIKQLSYSDGYSDSVTLALSKAKILEYDDRVYVKIKNNINIVYYYLIGWYESSKNKTKILNRMNDNKIVYNRIINECDNYTIRVDLLRKNNDKKTLVNMINKEGSVIIENNNRLRDFVSRVNTISTTEKNDKLLLKTIK